MNKSAISLFFIAIILILAQAVVFNHVCLWGIAIPFVFLYIIIKLPISLSKEWLFTLGFIIGFIIDIFSDTLGMNMLACTLLATLRRPALRLYINRDDELTDPYPSIRTFGMFTYIKYVLTISLIYCTLIFFIDAFSVFNIMHLLGSIITSTLLTTIIIVCIDSLIVRKGEKRL